MKKRYACIAILKTESLEKLSALQNKVFEIAGSKQFRKEWPPHITVGIGNELNDDEFQKLCEKLVDIAKEHDSLDVRLSKISFRENPRLLKIDPSYTPHVMHLDVEVNKDLGFLVSNLDKALRSFPMFHEVFPYNPHLTVAGRDLTSEGVRKLEKVFEGDFFETTVTIDSFSLVLIPGKDNSLERMKEVKRFSLGDQ